jgi:hypothetical protein
MHQFVLKKVHFDSFFCCVGFIFVLILFALPAIEASNATKKVSEADHHTSTNEKHNPSPITQRQVSRQQSCCSRSRRRAHAPSSGAYWRAEQQASFGRLARMAPQKP